MKYLWPSGGTVFGDVLAAQNMLGVPSSIVNGATWAADIGCLDGPEFVKLCDVEKAIKWIFETMKPYHRQCLFVTIPDVVGDASKTLNAFYDLLLRFIGWPIAYVAQDGAEKLQIPSEAHAVFIGGSTYWKMSNDAESVIRRAVELEKHVHIGRVNSWKRYSHFRLMPHSETFTCDGTRIRYERKKATEAWCAYQQQPPLFAFTHASAHASSINTHKTVGE